MQTLRCIFTLIPSGIMSLTVLLTAMLLRFIFFYHPHDTNDKSLTVSSNIQRQIDLLPQMGFSLCYNSFCVMKPTANRHKRNKLPPCVFSWLAGWQGAPHLVYDLLAEKRETALSPDVISLKNSDASPKCAGRKTNKQKKLKTLWKDASCSFLV